VDLIKSFNNNTETAVKILGDRGSWNQITIQDLHNNYFVSLYSRQRDKPNYFLKKPYDQFEANLDGMYNFFNSVGSQQLLKDKVLAKIASINFGIGVIADPSFENNSASGLILEITKMLDGLIFSNANSFFPINDGESALFSSDKKIILSDTGFSELKDLDVIIESKYYDIKN
jgi:hypothetical protein